MWATANISQVGCVGPVFDCQYFSGRVCGPYLTANISQVGYGI